MNRRYQTFAKSRRANDGELSIMEEFTDHLNEFGEVAGLYGDGSPFTVNTCNANDLLSQTLQYRYFFKCEFHRVEYGGKSYVLLQIHGGCDVRGGYTDAKVFTVDHEGGMFGNADAQISGKGIDDYWQTDDGYHYYYQGSSAERELNDYPISRDIDHKGDGEHVYIDVNGKAHSPLTGNYLPRPSNCEKLKP